MGFSCPVLHFSFWEIITFVIVKIFKKFIYKSINVVAMIAILS